MYKTELLFEIEKIREELNRLAIRYPLFSKEILSKSKQLDQLLNQYQHGSFP